MRNLPSYYMTLEEAGIGVIESLSRPSPKWLERDYPYVPPPNEEYTKKEMEYLISLIPEREEKIEFIRMADEDMLGLFEELCNSLCVVVDKSVMESIIHDVAVVVTKLKWNYNRPRPYQVAESLGLEFHQLDSKTANTPAYPSGHAIQSYIISHYLSGMYPQHERAFKKLADKISWSRVLGGYHWPSDIAFGRDVFMHMVNKFMPSHVRVAARYMRKNACIIAVGMWGGDKCLFKNRDRRYTPVIKVFHRIENGIEILYAKDDITGWREGMNELGIGVINSALSVHADESATGEVDPSLISSVADSRRDGVRVYEALKCKTVEEAMETVKTCLGGLRGHTFVADENVTYSLESFWEGDKIFDFYTKKLPENLNHVRTNHGQYYPEAGYTEKDGDSYLSSLTRKDKTMKVIRDPGNPQDIAPSVYGDREDDLSDPNNLVKMTGDMNTTTQLTINLNKREMILYLIPDQVVYEGYVNQLPVGYTPKIKFTLMKYTDIDQDGEFEVSEIDPYQEVSEMVDLPIENAGMVTEA